MRLPTSLKVPGPRRYVATHATFAGFRFVGLCAFAVGLSFVLTV